MDLLFFIIVFISAVQHFGFSSDLDGTWFVGSKKPVTCIYRDMIVPLLRLWTTQSDPATENRVAQPLFLANRIFGHFSGSFLPYHTDLVPSSLDKKGQSSDLISSLSVSQDRLFLPIQPLDLHQIY